MCRRLNYHFSLNSIAIDEKATYVFTYHIPLFLIMGQFERTKILSNIILFPKLILLLRSDGIC